MLDVIWAEEKQAEIFETRFSFRSCREISRQLIESVHKTGSWIDLNTNSNNVKQFDLATAIETVKSEYTLIVISAEVVISSYAVSEMIGILKKGYPLCAPVYNDTCNGKQGANMPYQYLNVSTYVEVSKLMSENPVEILAISDNFVKDMDLSCVMINTEKLKNAMYKLKDFYLCDSNRASYYLNGLDNPASSSYLPELLCLIQAVVKTCDSGGFIVNKNALVHQFGSYYSGERDQLVDRVPATANTVLDVGTARGGFGKSLRQERPDIHLSGIEKNSFLAQEARPFYDTFYETDAENLDLPLQFDHINCGEVIEHVYDPWALADKLYRFLKPKGTICMTVPNAGHWTVVKDLLDGQFRYITIGLQCVTHIRWFTESSILQLLEQAGFKIDEITRMEIPPTPQGEIFIRKMCELGYSTQRDLMTFDMIINAIKV